MEIVNNFNLISLWFFHTFSNLSLFSYISLFASFYFCAPVFLYCFIYCNSSSIVFVVFLLMEVFNSQTHIHKYVCMCVYEIRYVCILLYSSDIFRFLRKIFYIHICMYSLSNNGCWLLLLTSFLMIVIFVFNKQI